MEKGVSAHWETGGSDLGYAPLGSVGSLMAMGSCRALAADGMQLSKISSLDGTSSWCPEVGRMRREGEGDLGRAEALGCILTTNDRCCWEESPIFKLIVNKTLSYHWATALSSRL